MPYIALEGADGCGTTTHSVRLVERLRGHLGRETREVLLIKEPSEGRVGKFVRSLFEAEEKMPSWRTMMHLFQADRIELMESTVRPALDKGSIVVTDRFWMSSVVYSMAAFHLEQMGQYRMWAEPPAKLIQDMNRELPQPDLVCLLDLPMDEAIRRKSAEKPPDQYEENLGLMKLVHEMYASVSGNPVVRVDASGALEDTEEAIFSAVAKVL